MSNIRHTHSLDVRGMNPAWKLPVCLVFSFSMSMVTHPGTALPGLLAALMVVTLAHVPQKALIKALIPVNFFCLFLWFVLPWSYILPNQPPLFSFGFLSIYPAGLKLALLISLKANAITIMFLALAGTSSVSANGRALSRLRVSKKLVTLLLITHGNLALFEREAIRLWQAARLRGFVPNNSVATYKTFAWLVAMLLLRSWQKANHVEQAMRLRGFRGRFPLFTDSDYAPETKKHTFFLAGVVVFSGLLLGLDLFLLMPR